MRVKAKQAKPRLLYQGVGRDTPFCRCLGAHAGLKTVKMRMLPINLRYPVASAERAGSSRSLQMGQRSALCFTRLVWPKP